ncbi:hypothetical protein LCGC14_0962490 [marine sediment metagenome]|uniref:Uncharacterized protein n=1 Tax=marine sediment metagenome TaxID=412755 RepID=A0A0F9QXB1_9ZZZZ
MKISEILFIIILYLFQSVAEVSEIFNFILVFFGIILLIIILVYILLTAKQE